MSDKATQPLLEVRDLKTYFYTESGVVKAVDGVDFTVSRGEVLGLVGESGCGKSVTSLSIMRLIGVPGKIVDGKIFFEGKNLLELSEAEMVHMRGNRISMIFQQPQSSLNPVFKVADQVAEVLEIHQSMDEEEAWNKAVDLLRAAGESLGRAIHAQDARAVPAEARRNGAPDSRAGAGNDGPVTLECAHADPSLLDLGDQVDTL